MRNRVIRGVILFTLLCITYISSGQDFNSALEPNLQITTIQILQRNFKRLKTSCLQAIIIECKSGEIKAMVNLVNDKSGVSQPQANYHSQQILCVPSRY